MKTRVAACVDLEDVTRMAAGAPRPCISAAGLVDRLAHREPATVHPLVSVVVPTYRRPALLDRCLASLVAQTYPAHLFEILVVDDGPTEETRAVAVGWARQGHPSIRYLTVTGPHGPAAARNLGWRAAAGGVIAFTDDDCIPSPEWLAAGLQPFEDAGVAAVWGPIVVPLPSPPTDYQKSVAGLEAAPLATANCFYRRTVLDAVGGFDERFTSAWREDSDLHFAVLERGGRCVPQSHAVVVHPVRPAPWGVSLRLQRHSMFNALLYKKHPALYRARIQAHPPWRYYATVLALAVTGIALSMGMWALSITAGVVWMVLTARFCRQRLSGTSRDPRHVLEMIVTSALIPPLAVLWRVWGAIKYRVAFL